MKKIFITLILLSSLSNALTEDALLILIEEHTRLTRGYTSAINSKLGAHLEMIKKLNHKQLKLQARMLVEIQKQNSLLERILKKD